MTEADIKVSSLPQLIRAVFEKVEKRNSTLPKEEKCLTPDELIELHGLFGDVLDRALELLDQNRIKIYEPPRQNRQLIEVLGQNSLVYKFFPNINYCPCKAYKCTVLSTHTSYTCKHVLAAKLAIILDRCPIETLSDDNFSFLIGGVVNQLS